MVKIIDKINGLNAQNRDQISFSFEYFPPKTSEGLENLYNRIERMTTLEPLFIDVTWGAGGSTKDLSLAISDFASRYLGIDSMLHVTCQGLTSEQLREILVKAKEAGIHNILAVRGELPKGVFSWQSIPGGFSNTIELVRLIRQEFGDFFCIAVAGFPEGHPQSTDHSTDIKYLKEKIDAGADFILTQFFYEPEVFLEYVNTCRLAGITVPIIPGMMPIQSYSSFGTLTSVCKTKVPKKIWESLDPIRENEEEVKSYGVSLCYDICCKLKAAGVNYFHFYTMNLERSVLSILRLLGAEETTATRRALPWRGSRSNLNGQSEDVRPINWANRPKSYIQRTEIWDEFPNGRWGDGRSPAFGELSDYHFYKAMGSKEDRLAMWGEAPITYQDIYEVFAQYVENRVPVLPWCESSLQSETVSISTPLAIINRNGFLTINSQPAVNGEKSDHPVFGWGGPGGRVYQKAYIEFFTSPEALEELLRFVNQKPNLSLHAVNHKKNVITNSSQKGVTAVTWGVFPNREIIQPTIFDHDVFLIWSEEAFRLWLSSWASLYDDETDSAKILYDVRLFQAIHDEFFLVAIIDNDFVESDIFSVFRDVISSRNLGNSAGSEILEL